MSETFNPYSTLVIDNVDWIDTSKGTAETEDAGHGVSKFTVIQLIQVK